jgi:hypothetical protein
VRSKDLESQRDARRRNSQDHDDSSAFAKTLKALTDSANEKALVQRYTKQLDDQENHLRTCAVKAPDCRLRSTPPRGFEKTIQGLSFDETL